MKKFNKKCIIYLIIDFWIGGIMNYLRKRAEVSEKVIDKIMRENNVNRDIAEILALRGFIEQSDIAKFLAPDLDDLTPVFDYTGMREAADRIKRAVDFGESIVIYGDYDCDGVCATSILYLFLQSLGVEVNFYIPHRKKEGYGLHRDAIEEIAERYAPDLIITVDCGITSHDDILYGMDDLGLEFIVTDHHEAPEIIPECIVINPKVEWKENTFNELCGAGIALRLCEAIGGKTALMYYLDLACIATIGDIVPLVSDNRIIVNYGMQIVNSRARMNLKLLLEGAGINEESTVTSGDIGFKVVPRINAIGRLSDPVKAVVMMIDSDYFYVKHLVENACEYNTERQQFTDDLVEDALVELESYDLVNNRIIVLYSDKWEAGVLGIACSKLVTLFHRPVILMTWDGEMYKGSCRSVDGVNMYECLSATSTFLNSFGGHKMACGVSVSKENIESFIFAINEYVRRVDKDVFLPYVTYDLERNVEDITAAAAEDLSKLEPFGMANPSVTYKLSEVNSTFSRITTTKHIKYHVNDEFDMVYFDGYQNLPLLKQLDKLDVVVDLSSQVFRNRKYAQGIVKNICYDIADCKVDEDYLAMRYLYNAKYDNTTVFDINYIEEDKVSAIADELYGTCYIASNIDTFRHYAEVLKDNIYRQDIERISECNPYNRLVLNLDVSQNLAYYKKIVFLNAPVNLGVIDYYTLNKDAEVYIVADSIDKSAIARVKEHFPTMDRMKEIFLRIRSIIVKHSVSNVGELYDKYREVYDDGLIEIYLAMFVFFELKIFKVRGTIVYDNTVKASPESSLCYTRIRGVLNAS